MLKPKKISEGPVAIMGLGKTGWSAAKFLDSRGIEVWAWDDQESARAEAKSDGIKLKDLYLCDWSYPKFLILSPGIPEHYPTPHKVAALAIEHNCKIICDIDLLAQFNNEATFIGQGYYFQIIEPVEAKQKQIQSRNRLIEQKKSLSAILNEKKND